MTADRPDAGDAHPAEAIRSLERRILLASGLVLAGIAAAAVAGLASYRMLPAAACGAAIACGNFYFVRKILEKAFLREGEVNKRFVVQYVLKFVGLIGIVYLVVRSGWFDVSGFLLGLTSLFFGVLLEALWKSFRPAE